MRCLLPALTVALAGCSGTPDSDQGKAGPTPPTPSAGLAQIRLLPEDEDVYEYGFLEEWRTVEGDQELVEAYDIDIELSARQLGNEEIEFRVETGEVRSALDRARVGDSPLAFPTPRRRAGHRFSNLTWLTRYSGVGAALTRTADERLSRYETELEARFALGAGVFGVNYLNGQATIGESWQTVVETERLLWFIDRSEDFGPATIAIDYVVKDVLRWLVIVEATWSGELVVERQIREDVTVRIDYLMIATVDLITGMPDEVAWDLAAEWDHASEPKTVIISRHIARTG